MTRVGLVLGAGGLTGQAFHLGALTALADTGFDGRTADVLVGTSAGSLVAAALAAGLSVADQCALLFGQALSADGERLRADRRSAAGRLPVPPAAQHPRPAAGSRRRPLAPAAVLSAVRRPRQTRPGSLLAGLLPPGRTGTEGISRPFQEVFGAAWPDGDLRICAVRTRDAQRVVFGRDTAATVDVGTAVAASCAIPAYFRPVHAAGETYVDGGMHSPTNADVLVPDALDLVLVLSPLTLGPGAGRPRDLALRLLVGRYLAREVTRLRRGGARVVVLQPGARDLAALGTNPMAGSRARQVLEVVADSVRQRLAGQGSLAEALADG